MVSMETQKNDDEDEDEVIVQVVSSAQSTDVSSEPSKVNIIFLFFSITPHLSYRTSLRVVL